MSPELDNSIPSLARTEYCRKEKREHTLSPNIFFLLQGPLTWKEIFLAKHAEVVTKPGNQSWLQDFEKSLGGKLFGGYMEDRSRLFDERHERKALIHLGYDFWLPEKTIVTFPFKGEVVHSSPTNPNTDTYGGWGGRIDILSNNQIWILGHLIAPEIKKGDTITPGQIVGILAARQENGGWLPHLHVQCATLEEYKKFPNPRDMDAYASPSEDIKTRYPNPLNV